MRAVVGPLTDADLDRAPADEPGGWTARQIVHHLADSEMTPAARATSAQLLERLSEEDWARAGAHSESGRYGVEGWLRIYAAHGRDHVEQIRRAGGSGA